MPERGSTTGQRDSTLTAAERGRPRGVNHRRRKRGVPAASEDPTDPRRTPRGRRRGRASEVDTRPLVDVQPQVDTKAPGKHQAQVGHQVTWGHRPQVDTQSQDGNQALGKQKAPGEHQSPALVSSVGLKSICDILSNWGLGVNLVPDAYLKSSVHLGRDGHLRPYIHLGLECPLGA
ncbi:hypothetical protein H8959_022233 [Pygathrix nigripes]